FFEGYRELYQKVENAVRKHLGKKSTSYAQRFLGRLMFLYFLQKKGWLKGNKDFIKTIKDYRELNKLFYESLNTGNTQGIPFLNGSLFEKEEYMTAALENNLYIDMTNIFKEARNFFDKYNFTVDETAPLEVEVSIDPALIGTVFEDMLLEHERGSKGTFYTPKSESSFICRRALSNYLGFSDSISSDGKTFIDGLEKQINLLKEMKSEKEVREFREKLLSIKVLDPAVGSGGFLLAMMQEIITLIQEAEITVGWKSDTEEYKKRILPNLYGFDKEPEAVEIARLRLWLSLIIDQKEPEPLPNLDMNIMVINDSLMKPGIQKTLQPDVEDLREKFSELKEKYIIEHDSKNKIRLRKELNATANEIAKKTGVPPDVIEVYMPTLADIIVMNPPYVRQESIPEKEKSYYVNAYSLPKRSDLYAYFLLRALQLISDKGIVSVISSDKWLETDYGVELQRMLEGNLITIYGQKERSFNADINTVITVYSKEIKTPSINFVYLESYAKDIVIKHVAFDKKILKPGKWFYLRAPKIFLEAILPKLTHKLGDFAEIKFGIKTGANEFFYVKDISSQYEADYLADPKKFEEWGVTAKNEKELKEQNLIYIENLGKERFVVNSKDFIPLVKSIKEISMYVNDTSSLLCLYTEHPGNLTAKYINWGENTEIQVKGNNTRGQVITVKGYNLLSSTKNRRPWYRIQNQNYTKIVLQHFFEDRLFTPIFQTNISVDAALYSLTLKDEKLIRVLEIYLNSTIFLFCRELFCWRMGGGVGEMMVDDYEMMPVPDLGKMNLEFEFPLKRDVKRYFEEVKMEDRRNLDSKILESMGLKNFPLDELYKEFVDLVKDRLIKANRGSKSKEVDDDKNNR
ncbi:MAG: DNA methyltransferase, partial [Conexivisphaerales archaeon]